MNRIHGNVIIIDSAMGNVLALTSANQSMQLSNIQVNAFAVYATNSSTSILLTGANTATDIYFKHHYVALMASDTSNLVLSGNPSWYAFGKPQYITDLKAPIVTAGTVLLYLC